MKVTDEQVEAACDVAAQVYAGKLKRAVGIKVLTEEYGVNEASAGDYISDYKYLMQGRVFHRAMSAPAMRYFLEQIGAAHGISGLSNAVAALRLHIEYFEGYSGARMHLMRGVAEDFAAIVGPADATAAVLGPSFKHDQVFPVIYRLITDRTYQGGEYVSHTDLVMAMLQDDDAHELVAAAAEQNDLGEEGSASNMVAWFSHRYTTGENEFGRLLDRKRIGSRWAYRSKQPTQTDTVAADADAVFALEGAPQLVSHLKRERKPALVKAKLAEAEAATGRLTCECCGFDATKAFPGLDSSIVEVHHKIPLGASVGASPVALKDLAILCPTCHRAIHRSGDMSVDDFRAKYFPSLSDPH